MMIEASHQRASGQVALTTVFLIGSFIIVITLTLAFLSISTIASNYATRSADRASSIASGGIDDAILRLIRNNTFSGNYTVDLNGGTALIEIANTSDVDSRAVITASSTVGSAVQTIQAVVSIVSSTGQVSVVSRKQL